MKTYTELLAHCKAHSDWMYVYGMKGEVMTTQKYNQLKKQYGDMVWNSDANKIGKVCCDCSGLISSCTGILRGSSSFKANAPETVSIAELKRNWQKYVGWGLWLQGHIGVVSDTEGYYYAMDGSARNWVHYPISKNSWTHCIKLCDIDYSNSTPTPAPSPSGSNDMKGDFDSMTDIQKELFVENVLYIGLLDREADEGGKQHWINKLNNASVADVCDQFMESQEYRERTVTVAYERLLNREPDPEGFKHWVEWLKGEKTADDLHNAIMNSKEYKQKHGIK